MIRLGGGKAPARCWRTRSRYGNDKREGSAARQGPWLDAMHPWLVPSSGPPRPRCGSSCDSRSRPAALARRSREPARAAAPRRPTPAAEGEPRRPTPAATSCRVSDTAASCRVSDTAASCRVSVPPAADSRCPSIPPHTHTPKAAGQGPCLSVTLLSIPRFVHAVHTQAGRSAATFRAGLARRRARRARARRRGSRAAPRGPSGAARAPCSQAQVRKRA